MVSTCSVNYPTLSDGASCESSQPLRETFVLRSAVCRRLPSKENSLSTWHSVIATLRFQNHTILPSYQESCIPAFLSIFSELFCAKHYKNLAAFIPQLAQGDFPPIKLKKRRIMPFNIISRQLFLFQVL